MPTTLDLKMMYRPDVGFGHTCLRLYLKLSGGLPT